MDMLGNLPEWMKESTPIQDAPGNTKNKKGTSITRSSIEALVVEGYLKGLEHSSKGINRKAGEIARTIVDNYVNNSDK